MSWGLHQDLWNSTNTAETVREDVPVWTEENQWEAPNQKHNLIEGKKEVK